jgi:hypothetical protein
MSLSTEEKEACAGLYLLFTDGDIRMPVHRWNDAAAVELYEMIRVVKDCTKGMEWIKSIPSLIPKNSISTSIAAAKYLLSIWRTKISIDSSLKRSKISQVCKNSKTHVYINNILIAAYGLEV